MHSETRQAFFKRCEFRSEFRSLIDLAENNAVRNRSTVVLRDDRHRADRQPDCKKGWLLERSSEMALTDLQIQRLRFFRWWRLDELAAGFNQSLNFSHA